MDPIRFRGIAPPASVFFRGTQEITEAAMRGELDFFGSLKSRVALLKGEGQISLMGSQLEY